MRAGAQLKDVKLVGGEQSSLQEGAKEAGLLVRVQGGYWGRWRVIWFAFIPESGLYL